MARKPLFGRFAPVILATAGAVSLLWGLATENGGFAVVGAVCLAGVGVAFVLPRLLEAGTPDETHD